MIGNGGMNAYPAQVVAPSTPVGPNGGAVFQDDQFDDFQVGGPESPGTPENVRQGGFLPVQVAGAALPVAALAQPLHHNLQPIPFNLVPDSPVLPGTPGHNHYAPTNPSQRPLFDME